MSNNKIDDGNWIFLHRRILEWEWYDDIKTTRLFIHLLLKANWKDKPWRGHFIKRGQFLTSLDTLAQETGLSIQNIKTSLSKLKSTGEITNKSTNKNRMITVCNYNNFQPELSDEVTNKLTSQLTDYQQSTNNQLTTTNKDNKDNKNNKKNIYPTLDEVKIYFKENNIPIDPEKFFYHYDSIGWVRGRGIPIKKWTSCIKIWLKNEKEWTPKTNGNGSTLTAEEKFEKTKAIQLEYERRHAEERDKRLEAING